MRTKPLATVPLSLPVRKPIDMSRTTLNGPLLILHPRQTSLRRPSPSEELYSFTHKKPPSLFWQPRRSHAISIESKRGRRKALATLGSPEGFTTECTQSPSKRFSPGSGIDRLECSAAECTVTEQPVSEFGKTFLSDSVSPYIGQISYCLLYIFYLWKRMP